MDIVMGARPLERHRLVRRLLVLRRRIVLPRELGKRSGHPLARDHEVDKLAAHRLGSPLHRCDAYGSALLRGLKLGVRLALHPDAGGNGSLREANRLPNCAEPSPRGPLGRRASVTQRFKPLLKPAKYDSLDLSAYSAFRLLFFNECNHKPATI